MSVCAIATEVSITSVFVSLSRRRLGDSRPQLLCQVDEAVLRKLPLIDSARVDGAHLAKTTQRTHANSIRQVLAASLTDVWVCA